MKEYLQSADEVLSAQKSSPAGLSTADAGQRLEKFGKNKLAEAKKESLLHKFFQEIGHSTICCPCIFKVRISVRIREKIPIEPCTHSCTVSTSLNSYCIPQIPKCHY